MDVKTVAIKDLKPHPRNYQDHPEAQLQHIIKSIEANGFYRNVVIANDNTILAGHGVVQAATRMGMKEVPTVKINIDHNDPRALKLLIGDNEISNLAAVNDRVLTDMLKEIMQTTDVGLEGSGFNEDQLASLLFITRPASEIGDKDGAAEWVGMPDYERTGVTRKIVVSFLTDEDRDDFAYRLGFTATDKTKSIWWPLQERKDMSSIEFQV